MSTIEKLEQRLIEMEKEITRLKDIEAIKSLKGKYLRCLDSKLWDTIGECFCEDVTTSYSDGKLSFTGKEEVVNFFRTCMPPEHITMHQCHTPEIEFESDTKAFAYWYLGDNLILLDRNMGIRGGAFYRESYEKINGEWKIKTIGYKRTFEERWDRNDPKSAKITYNMHSKE
ncbi:Bile acid 7-alpha dehydratase [uncultured Clostridium sp.]|nr:Bile acid 7-alpha dehydratase [uncultured Clostridium sp.]SCI88781.1 Bile acid 7-alpha dehydratase [uncultured Clostridium sp.]